MTTEKMPKRKWSSGRGALVIIAVLFATSAVIRLSSGTGLAIAQGVTAILPETKMDNSLPQCETPIGVAELLADLTSQKSLLDARARKLDELKATLAVSESQLRINLNALVAAEEKLATTIATSETAAESDLSRLTSVYENMKPKQAATLFEEMTPEFAAGFVGRMRADAAADILAGLTPQAAYSISVILAGRNALAPTE